MGCGLGLGRQISMGSKRNVGIRLLGIIAVARVGADSLQVGEGYILETLGQIEIIRGVLILHVTLDLRDMDEELGKMADPEDFQKGWKEWIRPEHGGVCDRYLKKKIPEAGKKGFIGYWRGSSPPTIWDGHRGASGPNQGHYSGGVQRSGWVACRNGKPGERHGEPERGPEVGAQSPNQVPSGAADGGSMPRV